VQHHHLRFGHGFRVISGNKRAQACGRGCYPQTARGAPNPGIDDGRNALGDRSHGRLDRLGPIMACDHSAHPLFVHPPRAPVVRIVDQGAEWTRLPTMSPPEALYEQKEWLCVTLSSIGDAVITTNAHPGAFALTVATGGPKIGRPNASWPVPPVFQRLHPFRTTR
jgi:hypothetical protein